MKIGRKMWTPGKLQEISMARWAGMPYRKITALLHIRTGLVKQVVEKLAIALPERSCKYCGKRFIPIELLQIYCKSSCRANYFTHKWVDEKKAIWWGRRLEVIKTLGGKCVSCGNADPRVLQINHVNGGGSKDKSRGSRGIIPEILKGNRPGEFDLRCANCNILYEFEKGRRKTHDRECSRA